MGFADGFLAQLFRIAPPALPARGAARCRACRPGGGRNAAAGAPGSEARLRRRAGGGRGLPDGAVRPDPRSDRPQRLGQEHAGERRLRPLRAHRRADPAAWKAAGDGEPVPGGAGRGVAHLPEPAALQRADRAGERDGGAEGHLPQVPAAGAARAGRREERRAQAECPGAAGAGRARGRGPHAGQGPDLRRPALPGDRPGAGPQARSADPGRAGRGTRPPRRQEARGDHPGDSPARHHHHPDRAPHGRGERTLRRGDRARRRQGDRRGDARTR